MVISRSQLSSFFYLLISAATALSLSCEEKTDFLVVRVIDGDTIVLENNERVRYIGIDTPELPRGRKGGGAFAFEAKAYNQELVEGRRVVLEYDEQKRDRFGRILAYVYRGDVMINEELLRAGLARAVSYPPDLRHREIFERIEREAREKGLGLWKRGKGLP